MTAVFMSPVFSSTLKPAEDRFPAHRSSSRPTPDVIKSRLFSHRSTPRSSAKAPVSGLRPPPRKAAPEVQNFLHLLVQHRSQRATSTRLSRSCSQHLLECPDRASLQLPEDCGRRSDILPQGLAPVSGVFPAGGSFAPSRDLGSGNPAFAISRRSPRPPPRTPWRRPPVSWPATCPFTF